MTYFAILEWSQRIKTNIGSKVDEFMYYRNLKHKVGERGQNLVEFALVLPILLIVLFGALDLGRIFWVSISLTNAAREGARYITMHPDDVSSEVTWSGVRNHVKTGAEKAGLTLELEKITPGCVIDLDECQSGQSATVTVEYDFELVLGWLLPTPIELSRTVEMMVP